MSYRDQRAAHERAKREAIEQYRAANPRAATARLIGSQWCLSPSVKNSATSPGEVGTVGGFFGTAAAAAGRGEFEIRFSEAGTMTVHKEDLIKVESWHQYEMVLYI